MVASPEYIEGYKNEMLVAFGEIARRGYAEGTAEDLWEEARCHGIFLLALGAEARVMSVLVIRRQWSLKFRPFLEFWLLWAHPKMKPEDKDEFAAFALEFAKSQGVEYIETSVDARRATVRGYLRTMRRFGAEHKGTVHIFRRMLL